jgi:hypothetical protein
VARPPRNHGQRFGLVEGASPRGPPFYCTDKAVSVCSIPLYTCRVELLLLRQRRDARGNGLATTVKYLRQTTSGAAGNGFGAMMKYLRRITSGAAGNGQGTKIKYLRGAAGIGIVTTIK